MEMNRFENAVTSVSATHITKATRRLVVTASAEQIPRICRPMGFSEMIGLIRTFLASGDISISAFSALSQVCEEGTKSPWAHPVLNQVIHAAGRQRRAGQAVHLVLALGVALHQLQRHIALLVIDALAWPLADPARVDDLASQAGRFLVFVETNADHGVEIPLQRQ